MKKIKSILKRLNPFKVSSAVEAQTEYPEADAVYSVSGVDNADLDLNRLGDVIEMDES